LVDRKIAVYLVEGQVYATDDLCTHARASLSEGLVVGKTIQCPLHVAWFDLETGKGLGPPITRDLTVYKTRVVAGEVEVALPLNVSSEQG
jgi:nitrite reductase/ring-hydroxylating ferredoxin subunit